jgi:hypothetical protein
MIHALGPTGQLILQTLGFIAMVLSLILLTLAQFVESLQKYERTFTPRLFYALFVLCMILIVADLLFTTHHPQPYGIG